MTRLKQEIYQLLKIWCDGLMKYQITEIGDSNLKGGLLCPACSIIHGRCGNAIPAMLFLAEQEKDEKYIRCAEGLIDWSKQLLCPDGGFVNDTESELKGITTFAFISLCDAYFGYGHDSQSLQSEEVQKAAYICFQGADYYAVVYVNGVCVGTHEGFFSPFEFEITDVIQKGTNTLQVDLYNHVWNGQPYFRQGLLYG